MESPISERAINGTFKVRAFPKALATALAFALAKAVASWAGPTLDEFQVSFCTFLRPWVTRTWANLEGRGRWDPSIAGKALIREAPRLIPSLGLNIESLERPPWGKGPQNLKSIFEKN